MQAYSVGCSMHIVIGIAGGGAGCRYRTPLARKPSKYAQFASFETKELIWGEAGGGGLNPIPLQTPSPSSPLIGQISALKILVTRMYYGGLSHPCGRKGYLLFSPVSCKSCD